MSAPLGLSDEAAAAHAADVKQAAYFRWCLGDERQQVASKVDKLGVEMMGRIEDDPQGARRLQYAIRTLEAELRHLDKLIEKLDRRFADPQAARG